MSISESKSARSTQSSVPPDRNQPDEVFGLDVAQALPSPRSERKQSQITQVVPNIKDPKENVVRKSKFPANMWTTNDELLRLHYINKLEKSQQTDWPYKWSFLIDEYNALSDDMRTSQKTKDGIQKQIDCLRDICPPETSGKLQESELGSIPKTSTGMIGWKSSQKNYIQSKYPAYLWEKHCTVSFEKQMKWPSQSQY